MRKATKRKLIRYLMAYDRKFLTLLVILYVGIFSIILFPVSMEENSMAWFGGYVGCPIICVYLTVKLALAFRRLRSQMKELEAEGMLEKLLADLTDAEKEMGGNLYVGRLALYGKGSNRIALYRDVDHLYSILSDRRGRNPRDLMYTDAQGQERFLCQLDPIGDSNIEIEQLYRRIEKRQPHIKTGR